MNEQIKEYIDKYPSGIIDMYNDLRNLIFDSILSEPQETMWAKLPTYYVGESFVRLIPFKDHINIEAKAVPVKTPLKSEPLSSGNNGVFHFQKILEQILERNFRGLLLFCIEKYIKIKYNKMELFSERENVVHNETIFFIVL